MASPPANLRYERKLLARRLPLAEVLALVRRHPALFREVYPPRAVNNLYLDSPSLGDYFDHVSGAANRAKTRIRWYGALRGPIAAPMLERKLRRGLVGGKLSWPLPPLCVPEGRCLGEIDLRPAWAALPALLQVTIPHLRPSLVNRYQRRYFLSGNGHFRLTVDSDLQFLAPQWATGPVRCRRLEEQPVIIELKFGTAHSDQAGEVIGALPFRLVRCSKYVLGIEETAPR